jgi:hypothetical protein
LRSSQPATGISKRTSKTEPQAPAIDTRRPKGKRGRPVGSKNKNKANHQASNPPASQKTPGTELLKSAFAGQFLAMLAHLQIPHEPDDWLTLCSPSDPVHFGMRSHAYLTETGTRVCCTREMPSPGQIVALETCARRGLDFLLIFDPGWASGKPLSTDSTMVGIRWAPDILESGRTTCRSSTSREDANGGTLSATCQLGVWRFGEKALVRVR